MANFLKYGLIAGSLYAVYALALHFIGSDLRFNSSLILLYVLVFPIIFMVLATKADRNAQEGLISFGEALKTSFLTYLIFIVVVMVAGQLIIQLYSADDWNRMLEMQRATMTSMFNAVGMDQLLIDEEMEKITLEFMKEKSSGVGMLLQGTLLYAFLGLILSLIISAIMKKNPTP